MQKSPIGPLALAYLSHHPKDAAQTLTGNDAESIASLLEQSIPGLEPDQLAAVLSALPTPTGAECLALLPNVTAAEVVKSLSIDEIAEIVTPLPVVSSRRLLSTLGPAKLAGVRRILNYAPGSVGKLMHTNVTTLPSGISVETARTMLPTGRTDRLAVAFVLDSERSVKGMVAFQELATANGETELESLTEPAPPALKASQHLSEVRLLPIWQDHQYLPVVGAQGRFIGVLARSNLLEAYVNAHFAAAESEREPIDLLLSIAETVWLPLAYLFSKASSSQNPYQNSAKGEK